MEKVIQIEGQNIGISGGSTGTEVIRHNGVEVSRKFSLMGGTHVFTVNENGAPAIYEVSLKSAWHGMSYTASIKKNGNVVHTESIDNSATAIVVSAIVALPFALAIFGNPSEADHHAAIIEEYQRAHPVASAFTPNEIFEEECKYSSYLFFSETGNGRSSCSFGFFWNVSVEEM